MSSLLYNILGPLAKAALTWLGRRRLSQVDGSLTLSGLTGSVEIFRDRWGIPHIYAANIHDLFFAQGFVHAQDRLSELFGQVVLNTDRTIPTFSFNRYSFSRGNPRQFLSASY